MLVVRMSSTKADTQRIDLDFVTEGRLQRGGHCKGSPLL